MRALVGIAATVLALVPASAHAQAPAEPFDGTLPFDCVLQQAGTEAEFPDPDADPFCVEYDKRHQNVTELGVVEFLSLEPARVAAATPKCFYFQRDHWVGSIVQDDGRTETYSWDGSYYFDKAQGRGRRLHRELHDQQPERRPDRDCPGSRRNGSPTSDTGAAASTRRAPSTPIRIASRRRRRSRPIGASPSPGPRSPAAPRPRAASGRSIGGLDAGGDPGRDCRRQRRADAPQARLLPLLRHRRRQVHGGLRLGPRRVPPHEQPGLRRGRGAGG